MDIKLDTNGLYSYGTREEFSLKVRRLLWKKSQRYYFVLDRTKPILKLCCYNLACRQLACIVVVPPQLVHSNGGFVVLIWNDGRLNLVHGTYQYQGLFWWQTSKPICCWFWAILSFCVNQMYSTRSFDIFSA